MDSGFPVIKWIMIVPKCQGSITSDNQQPTTTYQFYLNYIPVVCRFKPQWFMSWWLDHVEPASYYQRPIILVFDQWWMMRVAIITALVVAPFSGRQTWWVLMGWQAKSNSGRGDPDSQIIKNHGQWQCVESSKQIQGLFFVVLCHSPCSLWSRAKALCLWRN